VIAAGSWTLDTVDSDFCIGETEAYDYSDSLSSLPRGRCFGRTPWPIRSTTLDMEKAADAYLSGKSLADQIALSKFMAAVEYDLPPVRSRTTTLDVPSLRIAGASLAIRDEWHKRLEGGAT